MDFAMASGGMAMGRPMSILKTLKMPMADPQNPMKERMTAMCMKVLVKR